MTSCSFHLFSPYFIFSKCAKVIKWSHKSMQHVAKSATSARNQWGTRSGTACWRSSKADVFPRFSIPPSATGILWVIQHRFGMFFSNFYSYFLYGTVVNLFSLFCKRNQSLFDFSATLYESYRGIKTGFLPNLLCVIQSLYFFTRSLWIDHNWLSRGMGGRCRWSAYIQWFPPPIVVSPSLEFYTFSHNFIVSSFLTRIFHLIELKRTKSAMVGRPHQRHRPLVVQFLPFHFREEVSVFCFIYRHITFIFL